ncbi:MAG: L-aspartate oxidase [Hyphomicrobiaceae bacterium]|nr:L-aspartate oxidase [Hyphomicrobiaceae bacterium]
MNDKRGIDRTDRAFRPAEPASRSGDIVIIGAGLAGLFTALRLAPLPVTVVAAAPLGEGASSVWAQGGIAAAVGEADTPENHATDTIHAGAGIVDADVAHLVAGEASARIADLLRYGVPFDRDLEGHFVLSREAAHSRHRVVRVAGDRAGAAIMQALIAQVRRTPSIRVLEGYEAEDLITEGGAVTGVRLIRGLARGNGTYELLPARAVVIATGGIGAIYRVTTNPTYARGEALAFAARAGAVVADAEFVQFHPTALDVGLEPAPLASEALRGEGALLINSNGRRFMRDVAPEAELAPRDIVARAVFAEIEAGRRVFLDCRQAIGAHFPDAFPTVYAHCKAAGIDPVTEPIPVAPAEHYHMGGIATDTRARTSVAGLWAVGEVASTGLHGANRLASNSLLEAVVFAARAADDIAQVVGDGRGVAQAALYRVAGAKPVDHAAREDAIALIRDTMSADVGVVRTRRSLTRALLTLREIADTAGNDTQLANMALAARLVTGSALLRTESRGGHYRRDYPDPDPSKAQRSFVTLDELEALECRIASATMAQTSETWLAMDAEVACAP